MHLFCVWGPWLEVEKGELLDPETKAKYGVYLIQERTCTKCGRKDRNIVETNSSPWFKRVKIGCL